MKLLFFLVAPILLLTACNSDDGPTTNDAKVVFKFRFDPDQERLGNFGEPQLIPPTHAAQTPEFNVMGAHYIELVPNHTTPAYGGVQVHESPVTNEGGAEAIDFHQALYAGNDEIFYTTNIENIAPGNYEYLRVSLSYQNYTIDFNANNTKLKGTIASFVGTNTFINSFQVDQKTVEINGNKAQGYWAFETDVSSVPVSEGQVPSGGTTVPNLLNDSSPIPPNSCLVTGRFEKPLKISGNETEDIVIVCSVSINNSFEWIDNNANGVYEPTEGDVVVDMGVRGLIPIVE